MTSLLRSTRTRTASMAMAAVIVSALFAVPATASRTSAQQTAYRALLALQSAGLTVRDTYQLGMLHPGDDHVYSTTLYQGNTYALVAAGCEDAYDVDLLLYDENWNLVDRDRAPDQHAIVEVSPRWTGTFYIVVEMYSATSNGAHWVVQTGYSSN